MDIRQAGEPQLHPKVQRARDDAPERGQVELQRDQVELPERGQVELKRDQTEVLRAHDDAQRECGEGRLQLDLLSLVRTVEILK